MLHIQPAAARCEAAGGGEATRRPGAGKSPAGKKLLGSRLLAGAAVDLKLQLLSLRVQC